MTQQWGNNQPAQWPAQGAGSGQGQQGGWGQQGFNQPQWGQGQQWGQQGAQGPQGQAYGQGSPWPATQGQPWPQQQDPWGQPQQQGPWGQPTPTPPRKRGGMGRVIALVLGIVILGAIGLALVSAMSKPRYANEEYRVPEANSAPPEIPMPETMEQVEQRLTANPLYQQKLASPVRCDMPQLDITSASDPVIKAYFESQMACLMRVWGPAFDATKTWQLYRPTVTVYGSSVATPCGQAKGLNAFYCPANQQLYYSRELHQSKQFAALTKPKAVDVVMAHEFGHFIQGRAGIVGARAAIMVVTKPSRPEALLLGRRSEVQADCLSGMWLRSVAQSRNVSQEDIQTFYETFEMVGDDRGGKAPGEGDHGQASSRRYWGQLGMSTDDIGRCNTWTVPKEQVR
ncbi:neutral zinc metallopeptidase [Mariniluteicoccus flavus]